MEPVSGKLQGKRAAGQLGEDIACRYLEQQGQTVLARNWRSGHLEIDIVTSDREGNLRFVEVKTRVEPVALAPEEQVNATKQRRLAAAARAYLNDSGAPKPLAGSGESFFDIVSVVLGGGRQEVEYFPAAWMPMYV